MFNTYNNGDVDTKIKINSCSGGIYKTYSKSWFVCFKLDTFFSDRLLQENGYIENKDTRKSVIVLQIVNMNENFVIAEVILKEDFNEILEREVEKNG